MLIWHSSREHQYITHTIMADHRGWQQKKKKKKVFFFFFFCCRPLQDAALGGCPCRPCLNPPLLVALRLSMLFHNLFSNPHTILWSSFFSPCSVWYTQTHNTKVESTFLHFNWLQVWFLYYWSHSISNHPVWEKKKKIPGSPLRFPHPKNKNHRCFYTKVMGKSKILGQYLQ